MYKKPSRSLLLVFILYCQFLSAQEPVIFNDSVQAFGISDMQMHFMRDPDCSILPLELLSGKMDQNFKVVDFSTPDPELLQNVAGSCYWFRFYLVNRSTGQFSFHLQRSNISEFDEYRLFQKFDNGLVTVRNSGNKIHPRKKDVNIGGSDDLRVYLPPGEADTLYLRVTLGPESVLSDLTFTIATQQRVYASDRTNRMVFGIFTGILLILVLYHIPLFVRGRETSYLYYILYLLSFLLFFINKEGYVYELIPRLISAPVTIFLLELFLLFFLLFGRSYLNTRITLRSWNKILLVTVWFTVGGLILNATIVLLQSLGIVFPFFIELGGMGIIFVSALGCIFLAIIPALRLARKKFHPARYFLFANLFLVLGIAANYALGDRVPGKYGLELGLIMQALTFSIGLSEKINLLKKENEQAQLRIIDQLKENADLKDKVNRELESKVLERTQEIIKQKEKIEVQRDKIESQLYEIEAQRDQIVLQRDLVVKQKLAITDSISYAQKIQSAILPTPSNDGKFFSEYFIFYQPRDLVSGDFYWFREMKNNVVIVGADCTGHGVPGAFMSMLGVTLLKEELKEELIDNPAEILGRLRAKVKDMLVQEGNISDQKDGMDMAFVVIDKGRKQLQFAGANSPLYLIRNKKQSNGMELEQYLSLENSQYQLYELKGDKQPIGVYWEETEFTNYVIKPQVQDTFYIFSDGFIDQFGGEERKKFKAGNFKKLLLSIQGESMEKQKLLIKQAFDAWRGEYEQIDDVSVIGVRI